MPTAPRPGTSEQQKPSTSARLRPASASAPYATSASTWGTVLSGIFRRGCSYAPAIHAVACLAMRLAKARLPEGVAGRARLHAIVGELAGDDGDDVEVLVGIETGRGP